jgi:alkylation response protein AidB-like acyl-CoA dehydrogenase
MIANRATALPLTSEKRGPDSLTGADMDDALNEESLILRTVDRFLENDVRPYVRRFEQQDIYPAEIVEKMKALGLFGSVIAAEYGGLGLSTLTYARIVERISAVWMSISGIVNSHLIMAMAVQRDGTEEQRRYFLPRFASGELRGGIGLTEPDCGTDLQAIRTVARRDGDNYLVNGHKTWITNSMYGNCIALLVKTDPNTQPPHKGMSLLIAEKGPGFTVTRKLGKLGYRGIDTCELSFDDYRVPVNRLIGAVEGHGLQQILSGLELGRINVAARGVGVADAALKLALSYSRVRKTFGKPICEHQAIALKLADMATRLEAARALTYQAAQAFDRGQRCDMEVGMAKLFATEAAMENSAEAMRIHGAYGYSTEFDVERLYRDAPLLVIGEGTGLHPEKRHENELESVTERRRTHASESIQRRAGHRDFARA